MIFDDENLPRNMPKKPPPLDKMSVEELEAGIAHMRDEITRYQAEIEKKKAHKAAVSGLFKS